MLGKTPIAKITALAESAQGAWIEAIPLPTQLVREHGREDGKYGYVVDVASPGQPRRQQRRRGFARERDALDALNKVARSVADGTHAPPSKLTVNELFETDLDTQTKLGRMKSSTAYTYRRLFDRYVKPRLGAVRAQDLRASDLDALYGDLLTGGRRHATIRRGAGLSAGTVTTVHAVLSGMFSRGVKPGDVAVNPCRRASPPAAQTSETPV